MSFGLGSLQRRLLGSVIPVVRVQGVINEIAVSKLEKSLSQINPQRSQAVAVLVNSPGGFIAPCQNMTDILKNFTTKHKLPLYTFADCMALSGGYWILSSGDKVFADQSSWVGSIGVISQYSQFQGLLKKFHVDVKTWKSNEDMILPIFDPLAEINSEKVDKKLLPLMEYSYDGFVDHVESFRDRKITVPKEERAQKLFQGDIWTGKEAANLGLVDKLGTFQEILAKEFPDAKLIEVTKTSALERIRERLSIIEGISSWNERTFLKNTTEAFALHNLKGK